VIGLLGVLSLGSAAEAQNCPPYSNQLANGTTADANQVMGNFNTILNCVNNNLAPLSNPHFTGNVGIGTTAPGGSLSVAGQITQLSANTNLSSGDANLIFGDWYSGRPADGTWQQIYWSHGLQSFTVTAATTILGNVGVNGSSSSYALWVNGAAAGTTAWTNTSDARLKQNIRQITGAIDLVKRLRGVRYQWRPVEKREVGKTLALPVDEPQIGFTAQDVEAVVPEAVVVPKAGSDDVYGLKDTKLLPILVEAVKEQQLEIEQLDARNRELETRIARRDSSHADSGQMLDQGEKRTEVRLITARGDQAILRSSPQEARTHLEDPSITTALQRAIEKQKDEITALKSCRLWCMVSEAVGLR
jgi:hypothetical protein